MKKVLVLSAVLGSVVSVNAYAAADAWATAMATYMSGVGLDNVNAYLGAAVLIVGLFWVAKKLGIR